MKLITKLEDFVGTALIPNAIDVAPGSDLTGNAKELQEFIEIYEPEAMMLVLGFSLYEELKSNLDVNGELPSGVDQKWIDLVDGKERYRGLKSLTKHYIFYKFLENDVAQYTGVGIATEKPKGATIVGATEKAVKAWNIFYDHTVGKNASPTIIRRGFGMGVIYNSEDNYYQPLQEFLRRNNDVYENATFTTIENMNFYGL